MWIASDFKSKKGDRLKLTEDNLNKFKLIWPKSGAWANWRSTKILEPGQLFSDTFIGVYFDSKLECENYLSYMKTLFYRFMVSERATDHNAVRIVAEFVPYLEGVMNIRTRKTGFGSDWTNEDLKVLFENVLNSEDWKYIEKTALDSDGGRKV